MTTYQYNGDGEREFPTLGLTLNTGDTFEASGEIISADVTVAAPKKTPTPSAAPDTTQGA
jgi:hypothetical protein